MSDITELPKLIGRTIVKATMWSDSTSLSLVLDDGVIVQINPVDSDYEPTLHVTLEPPPPRKLGGVFDNLKNSRGRK